METMCSESEMNALMEAITGDDSGDLQRVDAALGSHPEDPRLHFLRASLLAARGRAVEAHGAFERAIEIAPDFPIARFQLGFFELTSGEASEALATWGPLLRLPEDHYLRRFVEGLTHMIRDEFSQAVEQLSAGIELNAENPPLNNDMDLLRRECAGLAQSSDKNYTPTEDDSGETASATSLILGQFAANRTRH